MRQDIKIASLSSGAAQLVKASYKPSGSLSRNNGVKNLNGRKCSSGCDPKTVNALWFIVSASGRYGNFIPDGIQSFAKSVCCYAFHRHGSLFN